MWRFSWKDLRKNLKEMREGVMDFDLKVAKNLHYQEGSEEQPRFYLEVDLSGLLPGEGRIARLPVFWRPNRARHPVIKELYRTQVLGTTLEKGNLAALARIVPEAIQAAVAYGTLPYYIISLPIWGKIPVYLSGGKLALPLPDGATLSGQDIGQLWHRLVDHLLSIGKLQDREEIEVSIVLWKDLQIYPTALVFCDGKTWIPIFSHETHEGLKLNYDLIGVPPRFLEVGEVFALRREIAANLVATRAIASPFDLRMEQVRQDIWETLKGQVKPSGYVLSYFNDATRVEMPVFEAQGEVFALDNASKVKLIFSPDLDDLSRRLSEELARARKLPPATLLTLEPLGR